MAAHPRTEILGRHRRGGSRVTCQGCGNRLGDVRSLWMVLSLRQRTWEDLLEMHLLIMKHLCKTLCKSLQCGCAKRDVTLSGAMCILKNAISPTKRDSSRKCSSGLLQHRGSAWESHAERGRVGGREGARHHPASCPVARHVITPLPFHRVSLPLQ